MTKKLKKHRFHLPQAASPTYFNLHRYMQEQGHISTRFPWLARFSGKNFEFDLPASECLEFKHLLAKLVFQYCPNTMPETYPINDANWSSVLSHIAHKHYTQGYEVLDHIDQLVWILKPSLLNNGQHIKLFQTLSQIERHYLSSNRLGGEHVLQRYLTQPYLLDGHKNSIRMFVVITNDAGAYLYQQGYFNKALCSYQPIDFSDLRGHLTNEHLNDHESNVVQVPTQAFNEIFPPFYQQIKTIVTNIIGGLTQHCPQAFIYQKQRTIAIFGFDFMVDSNERVWLLEANHGPCFPTSDEHPLGKTLYYNFWQDFISSFVLSIANRQPIEQTKSSSFERIDFSNRQNCPIVRDLTHDEI